MKRFLVLVFVLVPCLVRAESTDSIKYVGACATPGIAWGVFVRDTFAYIADCGAVSIANISNPSSPWVTGTTSDAWANGIFVRDSLAYVNPTGMWGRLFILNIGNPDSLHVIGWCRVPAGGPPYPQGICIKDSLAYLATGSLGLEIVDVSDPTSPDTIKSYKTPSSAIGLFVEDRILKNTQGGKNGR